MVFKSHQKDQLSPCSFNRISSMHFWGLMWCDITWRPTEVYIDFGRPARRWKRWCLLDNDGPKMKAHSWTRFWNPVKSQACTTGSNKELYIRIANQSSSSLLIRTCLTRLVQATLWTWQMTMTWCRYTCWHMLTHADYSLYSSSFIYITKNDR